MDSLLETGPELVRAGGRMVVISFMSLDDRKVKERFRELAREGRAVVVDQTSAHSRRRRKCGRIRLRAAPSCARVEMRDGRCRQVREKQRGKMATPDAKTFFRREHGEDDGDLATFSKRPSRGGTGAETSGPRVNPIPSGCAHFPTKTYSFTASGSTTRAWCARPTRKCTAASAGRDRRGLRGGACCSPAC